VSRQREPSRGYVRRRRPPTAGGVVAALVVPCLLYIFLQFVALVLHLIGAASRSDLLGTLGSVCSFVAWFVLLVALARLVIKLRVLAAMRLAACAASQPLASASSSGGCPTEGTGALIDVALVSPGSEPSPSRSISELVRDVVSWALSLANTGSLGPTRREPCLRAGASICSSRRSRGCRCPLGRASAARRVATFRTADGVLWIDGTH